MRLSHSQRRRVRRAVRAPELDPSESGEELNIIPFLDVVVNLVMFMLLTMTTALSAHQVSAQLPGHGPTGSQAWRANVVLTSDGVLVADGSGTYAAGCHEHGGVEPTVGLVAGESDWLALRTCAETLHRTHPETASVTVSADPDVPLSSVISAMDALRGGPNAPLFPDVLIAAGIR